MAKQNTFRLRVNARPGVPERVRRFDETLLNREPGPVRVQPEKLLADLLKRQARQVCCDITECPPVSLPAHLARLDGLREVITHHLRHDLAGTDEASASGAQLRHPSTLADWLEVMRLTRKDFRAPAFINSRDEQLEKIFRGIDQIAGLIGRRSDLVQFLAVENQGGES